MAQLGRVGGSGPGGPGGAAGDAAAEAVPHPAVVWAKSFPEVWILAGMGAITAGFAAHLGAPFVVPDGRISYYLGFRYAVPIAMATVWYVVPFISHWLAGGNRPLTEMWRESARNGLYLFAFTAVMWMHFHIKMWIPLINPARYDDLYLELDRAIQPAIDLMFALRQFVALNGAGVDYWYMWAFILMFFLSFSYHCVVERTYFRAILTATLVNQSLGALAYLAFPAVGPFLYDRGANALAQTQQDGMWAAYNQLVANGVGWLEANGAGYFNAGLAAMPSLHVGASWVFIWYAWRARSVLFPVYVPLFAWILMEAVTSKWHYVIDLPAGFLLAACSIWIANRICRGLKESASIRDVI
jgi:hypothetical protein